MRVSRHIRIDADCDVVRRQFGDVAHHQVVGVHRGTEFSVVSDQGDRCVYDQRTRVGPIRLRQRFELDRRDPGLQVNRVVAGPLRGASLTFAITAAGGATDVEATLAAPVGRLRGRALAPVLGRSLAAALEEDRAELEAGAYPASSAGAS